MSLSHHDLLEIMGIDGVTSVLEKGDDPLVIGILDHDAKRSVKSVLRTLGIEQSVRFVVSRSDQLVATAELISAETVANERPAPSH
jgi:hypothetical protein